MFVKTEHPSLLRLTGDRLQTQAILLLRWGLSSGGRKPVQFLVFGLVMHCETTVTQVTFKPLVHTTAETIG